MFTIIYRNLIPSKLRNLPPVNECERISDTDAGLLIATERRILLDMNILRVERTDDGEVVLDLSEANEAPAPVEVEQVEIAEPAAVDVEASRTAVREYYGRTAADLERRGDHRGAESWRADLRKVEAGWAPPVVDVTPGCEGGAWCRCPKSTPCYPPAAGAVDLDVAAAAVSSSPYPITAKAFASPFLDVFAIADELKARYPLDELAAAPGRTSPVRGLRDLRRLVSDARRTDVVDLDDEQVDPVEFVRLLDDPATWARVHAAMRARGVDVDDELVEQVRRSVAISERTDG